MKEYRYKAPADSIMTSGLGLVIMLLVLNRVDDTAGKIVIGVIVLVLFVLLIHDVSVLVATNINTRNIILKEDRILIPHIFSDRHTTFYFKKITSVEAEIITTGRRRIHTDTIIRIKSGKLTETTITRSWLESNGFNELFDTLRNRVEIARKDMPKQVEVDDEHQLYEPPRKITFERGEFFKRRFS